MAWPWQWGLDWVSAGLEGLLRAKALPLPDTRPFQDERRWQLAKAIMRMRGFQHGPIDREELQRTAESLLSYMTNNNADSFQPQHNRRLVFSKDEVVTLMREVDEDVVLAADGRLHRPYPAPDVTTPRSSHVSSMYSDESLRALVEHVYSNALVIYQDLVTSWFPALATTLGLGSIMPVLLGGHLRRAEDHLPLGGPEFAYRMELLSPTESPRAEVRLVTTREDLHAFEPRPVMEYFLRLRQEISRLHPGAEGWASPRAGTTTVWVWGDVPATSLAYQWLWEDLQKLHLVKRQPPMGED
jgi:hypothetical protein